MKLAFFLRQLAPLWLALLSLVSPPSLADEFQPITVRIKQTADGDGRFVYMVETRTPNDSRIRSNAELITPEGCETLSSNIKRLADNSTKSIRALQCSDSLRGTVLNMNYGAINLGLSSIISVDFDDGQQVSTVLASDERAWRIPPALTKSEIAQQYLGLGFKHLLTGFDHLLFVICLLFICLGRVRILILTVTSFTIAHSVSLGLTAFGLISLHTKAVEAIIALSIAYLANDIIRHFLWPQKRPIPLSHKYPTLIAGLFGLVHGLGFANILNEFGLPQTSKLLALFGFNIGIELGQLAFIGALLIVAKVVQTILSAETQRAVYRPFILSSCYFVGVTAMFWTLERFLGIF